MLYAITNRKMYGADEASGRRRLLELAAVWAANGVDFIQIREKDLPARGQVDLTRAMRQAMRAGQMQSSSPQITRLLINGRPDVAIAAGLDGVHLPSGPDALMPEEVRQVFASTGSAYSPWVSVACHTLEEVEVARRQQANCILFAPVFEKVVEDIAEPSAQRIFPGIGLALLEQACRVAVPVPVFALGGVTVENAAECICAGAAGVAGIRLMMDPADIWRNLCGGSI